MAEEAATVRAADRLRYPYHDDDWEMDYDTSEYKVRRKYGTRRQRIVRAAKELFSIYPQDSWQRELGAESLFGRVYGAYLALLGMPDAPYAKYGGGIYWWSEDAYYAQATKPSIGRKVEKFLREQPDNPYAQEIAEAILEATKDWDESA